MKRGLAYVAILCVLIAGGGWLGFWLYAHLIVGLTLTDQPGMVLFQPEAFANTKATNRIKIGLDGYIDATVPFKQTLELPVKGTYDADIVLDTTVPIQMVITYKGAVPVDTIADIHGVTDFTYRKIKRLRDVAFEVKLPLKFEQPVSFVVPVNTKIHFVYRGPVRLALDQTIAAPVDTVLKTRLKVAREVTAPVLASFGLRVHMPATPVPVIIKHADLGLRVKTLRLEKEAQANAPASAAASPAASPSPAVPQPKSSEGSP
ncbi:MAG: hypothetical protein ACRETW_06540 [Stenotrophobium sp.]